MRIDPVQFPHLVGVWLVSGNTNVIYTAIVRNLRSSPVKSECNRDDEIENCGSRRPCIAGVKGTRRTSLTFASMGHR